MKKVYFFALISFLLISSASFYLGTQYPTTKSAAQKIMQQQSTWRLQYHSTGSKNARQGFWASPFKPRFTGAAGFVSYRNELNKKNYLLLTLQERIFKGKKIMVAEPPAGFFNGSYPGTIPHFIAESAEKRIAKNTQQGLPANQEMIYQNVIEHVSVPENKKNYVEDHDLWETIYREIDEEAGLDIKSILNEESGEYRLVKEDIFEEVEVSDAYVSVRHIMLAGKTEPPKLANIFPNEEIFHAQWVALDDIDFNQLAVNTAKGTFTIKPFDNIASSMQKVVTQLHQRS